MQQYTPIAINSRIETEEVLGPLPDNWEKAPWGKTGRSFFVDHNEQTTTWVDPRTYHLRKHDIREIVPGELPYGWEEAFDKDFGVYYIDHATQAHFLDAPWEDHVRDQVLAFAGEGGDAELQGQLQKEREMKDELDAAQANLEQLAQEKERLEQELSQLQESGDGGGEEEEKITGDLQDVSVRIEREQGEVDRVAAEYGRLQQEIEEFQNRLAELRDVNERLDNEYAQDSGEADGDLEEMRNMIEQETAQRNALESYIKQLKTAVLQLYDPDGVPIENEDIVMDAPLPASGTMTAAEEMAHLKSRLNGERMERERLKEMTETLEAERIKGADVRFYEINFSGCWGFA